MTGFKRYVHRVTLSFSVLLNVILGGRSHQTFSARNYQWQKDSRRNVAKFIDAVLGEGHCQDCWVHWKIREYKW